MPLVTALRELGHDVLTAREAGCANQGISDAEQLRSATALGRAILTHDRRHFRRLHRANPRHAGIVAVSQSQHIAREAARLHELIEAQASLAGRFLCLDLPSG